jgi:hypothetical protein
VPDAVRKPGKAVCQDCRVDPRDRGADYEHRRRLRRYGITQQDYDALFEQQCGRCRGCGTDVPGAKGWCIDHDHKTGRVRALMCSPCNTVLGLVAESPATLRALAHFLEQTSSEIKI